MAQDKSSHCRLKAQYKINRQYVSQYCTLNQACRLFSNLLQYWHGLCETFSMHLETGTTHLKCLKSCWQSQYSTSIKQCTVLTVNYYLSIIYCAVNLQCAVCLPYITPIVSCMLALKCKSRYSGNRPGYCSPSLSPLSSSHYC